MGTTSSSQVDNNARNAHENASNMSTDNTRKRIEKMDKTMKLLLYQKGATVRFNMKIVIRGDRKSGKSSLLRRLQGLSLSETYRATPEIECQVINWSYKNDFVKIDFWDTVDVGLTIDGTSFESIGTVVDPDKLAGIPRNADGTGSHKVGLLDARIVNPYLGAHGVVVIFNPYTQDSLEYIRSICENVPQHLPILLLSNFADLKSKHGKSEVSKDELKQLCSNLRVGSSERHDLHGHVHRTVHFLEASLKTGSGMKALYEYLRIPFLHFRKAETKSLLKRLCSELQVAECDLNQVSDLNPPLTEKLATNSTHLHDLASFQTQPTTSFSRNRVGKHKQKKKFEGKKIHRNEEKDTLEKGLGGLGKNDLYEFQSKDRQRLNAFLADAGSDGEDNDLATRKQQQRDRIQACIIES